MHDRYTEALRRHGANIPAPYNDPDWQLSETQRFLESKLPRFLAGGFNVLEIGPGACPAMYLLREAGNLVWGSDCVVDAPTGKAMVAAYKRIADELGLAVTYHGFERYLRAESRHPWASRFDLILLRRSLSAVMTAYGRDLYAEASDEATLLWAEMLVQGGMVYIQHNHGAAQEVFHEHAKHVEHGEWIVKMNTDTECILVRR